MKPNQVNGESRIEILGVRMEQCIEGKNRRVKELDKKITEAETDVERINSDLRLREESLRRLRARQEVEEIKCFEEISRIHKEIMNIAESISLTEHT